MRPLNLCKDDSVVFCQCQGTKPTYRRLETVTRVCKAPHIFIGGAPVWTATNGLSVAQMTSSPQNPQQGAQ